jgi:hypothetical protein
MGISFSLLKNKNWNHTRNGVGYFLVGQHYVVIVVDLISCKLNAYLD